MAMLEEAIERLQKQKGEWPRIAQEMDVSYSWLCRLGQGKIDEPSVVKIEKLLSILKEKEPANPC